MHRLPLQQIMQQCSSLAARRKEVVAGLDAEQVRIRKWVALGTRRGRLIHPGSIPLRVTQLFVLQTGQTGSRLV
jgi:hypothetical protein